MEEETILRAFSQARDMFLFTNRRYVIVDTKGLSGQRVQYKSILYKHIHGFEFETAGHLDRDAELYCYTTIAEIHNPALPRSVGIRKTKLSILVKHTDIYEMGQLLLDRSIVEETPKGDTEPEIEVVFD